MSDPNTAPAVVPDTATPTITQDALNGLSPEARSTWEATGEWPDPAKVTTTETRDPETPDTTPASAAAAEGTDANPTADAVAADPKVDKAYTPPDPKSRRSQKEQERINERIRTAVQEALAVQQAELAELKAKLPKDAPEPTKPDAVVDPKDPEPQEANFDTYGQYVIAAAKWATRQAKREADAEAAKAVAAQTETSQRAAFQERAHAWIGRRDTFVAAHPEKADRLLAFLDDVHSGTPIGDVILESEVGAEVADYLAEHQDEAARIARLPPLSALRALGKLEAKFDSTLTSASASAGPAAKTVTTAPAPPTTLAARSATPADSAAAALARGDYAAWEAETNRKALAAAS